MGLWANKVGKSSRGNGIVNALGSYASEFEILHWVFSVISLISNP